MQIYLFAAAIIAVLAVIFALQNAITITVHFLFWQVESSLALILILSFIAGLVTSFLYNTLTRFRQVRSPLEQNNKSRETKEIETKSDSDRNTQEKQE